MLFFMPNLRKALFLKVYTACGVMFMIREISELLFPSNKSRHTSASRGEKVSLPFILSWNSFLSFFSLIGSPLIIRVIVLTRISGEVSDLDNTSAAPARIALLKKMLTGLSVRIRIFVLGSRFFIWIREFIPVESLKSRSIKTRSITAICLIRSVAVLISVAQSSRCMPGVCSNIDLSPSWKILWRSMENKRIMLNIFYANIKHSWSSTTNRLTKCISVK